MKIIGAGLSKTSTFSLAQALSALGFQTIHYDTKRLNDVIDGTNLRPDFRRYDDVEAVVDLPAAWFFHELLDAYPEAKCILTVRDEDSWWASIRDHAGNIFKVTSREQDPLRWDIRYHVFGSVEPREFTYRKRYREHNARVRAIVPPARLLEMNIVAGDGWKPLCDFLGVAAPNLPFPHANKRQSLRQRAASIAD